MKKVWLSNSAHAFLKEKAKNDKKSIIETTEFILEVFKQVTANITFRTSNQNIYNTYKTAFYEQNKHLLKEHERKYFESSKEHMRQYWKEHKAELQIFRIAYLQKRKNV